MGRQEWEDSLKANRRKIERARVGFNGRYNGGLGVSREQRWNWQVDEALRSLPAQGAGDARLDFLESPREIYVPRFKRFFYAIKSNNALVNAKDADRERSLGVLFFFNEPEGRPSPEALALLLSHCTVGHPHNSDPAPSVCNQTSSDAVTLEAWETLKLRTKRDEKRCICSLLSCYLDEEWERERPLRLWPNPYFKRQEFFKDREPITIQFMFRYAVLSEAKNGPGTKAGPPGIWPQSLRSIPSFRQARTGAFGHQATSIVERRHLLFMKYFPRGREALDGPEPPYHFTLISLGPLRRNELHEAVLGVREDEARKTGDLAPVVLFIKYLRRLLVAYTEEWDDVLARIDREISFKLSEIEDYSEGSQNRAMMYDDASHNTSTAYFKLFQVLRTLEGMVEETLADFRDWHYKVATTLEGPSHTFEDSHLQNTVGEWREWGKRLEARLAGVRQRIADKRVDVQSLSDNMFNATSINEARQSTVLNQLVLVFTIVTVVYTPLGFVTALFGMNNIQEGSVLSSSWVPFGYVLTIVCLTTYLVTLVSVWWLGWIKLGKEFREYVKGLAG